MSIVVRTWLDGPEIHQEIDVFGNITHSVVKIAALSMEQHIRDYLIAKGWTPPKE